MAFTDDVLNPIDRIRLTIGDTDPDNPLISSQWYQWYLSKDYTENAVALEIARKILAMYAGEGARQRGQVEVYGKERFDSYLQWLKDLVANGITSAPIPYAGGQSLKDMIENDSNLDNVRTVATLRSQGLFLMIKITRKTKNFEKLAKKLQTLAKESVESGYFKEQPDHPEAGMSYAQLMTIHEYGYNGNEERPVRDITMANMKGEVGKILKRNLFKLSEEQLLDVIGKDTTRFAKSVFGDTSLLASNSAYTIDLKGFDAPPLVDSGLLANNWSYRVSINGKIVDESFI